MAAVDCAACSIVISDCIWVFIFICCSTPANCTSCCVNWLVSSGSSGFWFCSCVVSSVRKVWKLLATVVFDDDVLLVELVAALVAVTGAVVVASTAIAVSLNPDVQAAAGAEQAAIVVGHDGRHGFFLGEDQAVGVGIGLVAVLPLGRLVAQGKLQPAVAGGKSG